MTLRCRAARRLCAALLLAVLPGCAGALPRAGDRCLEVRPYYGFPIYRKSFFWDGNGDVADAGVKARYLWQLADHYAIGAGLTAAAWFPSGADPYVAEVELVQRIYCYRSADAGLFFEGGGGYVHSTEPIPPGGTEWNFTFSFGPGIDVPLEPGLDLLVGADYHHVSNALGRENDRNPSQNEAQLFLGLAWHF